MFTFYVLQWHSIWEFGIALSTDSVTNYDPNVAGNERTSVCPPVPPSTSDSDVSAALKFREAELIQYLSPVGLGPSSNT